MATTAAIVLTGGLSTRMGTDKASLVVDGTSLLDRVLHAVTEAGIDQVAIVGPGHVSDAASPNPGAAGQRTTDERQGPLAGVVGGWQHLCATIDHDLDMVAVLACDLPGLTAHVVIDLGHAAKAHAYGAVAHDGERPQPVLAVYRARALELLELAFSQGQRSIRRCSAGWDLATVAFDASLVADADTPADLKGFTVEWPG